jgi:hypothetical protein
MTQRSNEIQGCEVSLMCFTLADPSGKHYNYYSGLVDLPADFDGSYNNYILDNSPQECNNPITYDESTNTFTVSYSIPESLYNPNGAYKTFMLPIYTDQSDLAPNEQMQVKVVINQTNAQGATTQTVEKLGTVSTIRTVHNDEGPSLDLIQFVSAVNYESFNCLNTVIQSCTQSNQYFVILWSCIPQTTSAFWPLMWKPNASIGDSGSSMLLNIDCNWWNWANSPAECRQMPAPNPIPEYTIIIGSIESYVGQYLNVSLEGHSNNHHFSNIKYQEATSM